MFHMGEWVPRLVPRRHETHSEAVSAHLLNRRGRGMGKGREGSREREEKDGKGTCQFSSQGSQHRVGPWLLSEWAVASVSYIPILPHLLSSPHPLSLHPLQPALTCRAQSLCLLSPAFSQPRPTCPESQYSGDSLLMSLRVKESESQG